jgi:hypothetical protein
MAKEAKQQAIVLPIEPAAQEPAKQNTNLGFEVNGAKYRVVDFHEEMSGFQDEDILEIVADILPAASALNDSDEVSNLAALSMLAESITGEKALLRRLLAILFLPEKERVYKRGDIEQRMEIIGNLPNKQFLPLLGAVKDFFVFAGANFQTVSGMFSMGQK